MKKLYGIYDVTAKEFLAENLNFDDMAELLGAYIDFYSAHEIVCFYRVIKVNDLNKQVRRHQDFTAQWFNLLEENLCNIYWDKRC